MAVVCVYADVVACADSNSADWQMVCADWGCALSEGVWWQWRFVLTVMVCADSEVCANSEGLC